MEGYWTLATITVALVTRKKFDLETQYPVNRHPPGEVNGKLLLSKAYRFFLLLGERNFYNNENRVSLGRFVVLG